MDSPGSPTIGITLGDPAGIGPEIVRAALADPALPEGFRYRVLGGTEGIRPGHPGEASARAAWQALEEAAHLLNKGEIEAVVTAPISKHAMRRIGFGYPGHTEFFAARTGTADYAMLLTGGPLTVALVTIHVPLVEVPNLLSVEEIVRTGSLLARFMEARMPRPPRLAVAGLNPHAGEHGDLGREEIHTITPAVHLLRERWRGRAEFTGPHAPDTLFHRAAAGEFDAVLAMYHDQGLIPLKLLAFDTGVNVTLGLPHPRTSPDHGTAYDLAGTGRASHHSMLAAIRLAGDLCRGRPAQPVA